MEKIFCIGLSHTGTNSLTVALELLGHSAVHYPLDRTTYRELSEGQFRLSILSRVDAIADITVAPFFRDLDRAWPGSRFILTTRDKTAWLKSMHRINLEWRTYANRNFLVKYGRRFLVDGRELGLGALRSVWFRMRHEPQIEFYRVATYGGLAFADERRLGDVYDDHHARVVKYFDGRPQDLLVMNIAAGEGWEKLCPFLNCAAPAAPFPHVFDERRRRRFKAQAAARGATSPGV